MNKIKNKKSVRETVEQRKVPMKDSNNYSNSKKYQNVISNFSKIGFFITLVISILIYKNAIENKLLEKDKELENIKEKLNDVTKEKTELQSEYLIQNTTLQNQILLLQNQYSKYENDIISNKSINKELKDQLKLYQNELKEEFLYKADFEKQIKNFENVINKYVEELKNNNKEQSIIVQKKVTQEIKEYYDKKINELNKQFNSIINKQKNVEINDMLFRKGNKKNINFCF